MRPRNRTCLSSPTQDSRLYVIICVREEDVLYSSCCLFFPVSSFLFSVSSSRHCYFRCLVSRFLSFSRIHLSLLFFFSSISITIMMFLLWNFSDRILFSFSLAFSYFPPRKRFNLYAFLFSSSFFRIPISLLFIHRERVFMSFPPGFAASFSASFPVLFSFRPTRTSYFFFPVSLTRTLCSYVS